MSDPQHSPRSRGRRRFRRPSDAEHIDRSADTPRHGFTDDVVSDDAERPVPVDEGQADDPAGEEFWREQRPPHHGE